MLKNRLYNFLKGQSSAHERFYRVICMNRFFFIYIFSSPVFWPLQINPDVWVCRSQVVILFDLTYMSYMSFHVSRYASLLALFFKCLSAFRSGIIPHLGGARRASSAILAAGQPGQQQRSSHQLSGLSERHICGGQDAPACGQVQHMQRGHRESKAALWMMSLSFPWP